MSETTITTDLRTIQFRRDLFREYVRTNRFSPYTGRGVDNAIVQKMGSDPTLRHPLVTRLTGNGVSGNAMLRGNGEAIGNFSWDTNPTWYRNAIEFNKEDLQKTNLALMAEARPLLLEWMMNETRDRQIQGFGAIWDGTTYSTLDDAEETAKDAWLVANLERTIFGANQGSGTDHSADLAQIDSSSDKFTFTRLRDMRRKAEDADPHIHPLKTDQESEIFVVFAGSVAFRDFRASLDTINQNADLRGMKLTKGSNILARDNDLFFEGCVIRKVPEMGTLLSGSGKSLENAGASGTTRVELVVMCGRQALAHGMGTAGVGIVVDRDFDFKFRPAVAVEMKEDIKKFFFNDIQHGMVTGYFSGAV